MTAQAFEMSKSHLTSVLFPQTLSRPSRSLRLLYYLGKCASLDFSLYLKLTPFSLLPKHLVYLFLIKEDNSRNIRHDTFIGLFTRHVHTLKH